MYFTSIEFNRLNDFYNKNGFIVIKNFINQNQIKNLKIKINMKKKKFEKNFSYFEKIKKKPKLRRIEKISEQLNDVKKLVNSKKIFSLLKKLTKKNNVLFKDKLNFKYPGGKGYVPHIDGHFYWRDKNNKIKRGWSIYSNSFTNVVIPLEKTDIENGCLYLSSKKDFKKLGNNWTEVTEKLDKFTPNIKKKFLKKFKFFPAVLNAGDILIFDWHCAHKSSNNNSKRSRMIFYATYCSKIRNIKNVRKKYYNDKEFSKNNSLIKSLQFN